MRRSENLWFYAPQKKFTVTTFIEGCSHSYLGQPNVAADFLRRHSISDVVWTDGSFLPLQVPCVHVACRRCFFVWTRLRFTFFISFWVFQEVENFIKFLGIPKTLRDSEKKSRKYNFFLFWHFINFPQVLLISNLCGNLKQIKANFVYEVLRNYPKIDEFSWNQQSRLKC